MVQNSSDARLRVIAELQKSDRVVKSGDSTLVCLRKRTFLKISDLPIVSSLSADPGVRVEVPMDQYYEFDSSGNLTAQIVPDEDSVRDSVSSCLSSISGNIGKGKMWDVEGGVLKRQFVV
jgi:hypothetical protein